MTARITPPVQRTHAPVLDAWCTVTDVPSSLLQPSGQHTVSTAVKDANTTRRATATSFATADEYKVASEVPPSGKASQRWPVQKDRQEGFPGPQAY